MNFYMGINIKQMIEYYYAFQYTKRVRRLNPNPNFLNWINNSLLCFYLIFMQTIVNIKSNQIILHILILSECYY